MKYFVFFLIVYIVQLYDANSFLNLNSKLALNSNTQLIENCHNPCLACQNSLYFLKFRGDAECKYNSCPGLCMSLSGQWNSGRDTHMIFFKSDEINICETCFRSNHCHINDCILEKTIVHNAITHVTEKFPYHYLNPSSAVFNKINKNSDDYFFNMDFIFKNFEKILKLLTGYDKVYSDSNSLKKLYKILIKFLSDKTKLNLSDFNLGLEIEIEEDMRSNWKDIVDHLRIYKNYYLGLKSQKIKLNEEKVYLSTDIQKEEDSIKNIIDFDNKLKLNLEKAHNITEMYKIKCHEKIDKLIKFVAFVDIMNSKRIDNLEKIKFITSDKNFTVQHVLEVLTQKKVVTSMTNNNFNNPLSIIVAGKTIKINSNPDTKINGVAMNINNNLVPNPNILTNNPINLNTGIGVLPVNLNQPGAKTKLEDEIDLFDEDEETIKKVISNKNDITNQKSILLGNRIQEPSIGSSGTLSTQSIIGAQIANNNMKKWGNSNINDRIKEPSLGDNGLVQMTKSTINIENKIFDNNTNKVNAKNKNILLNNNLSNQNNISIENNFQNIPLPNPNIINIPLLPNISIPLKNIPLPINTSITNPILQGGSLLVNTSPLPPGIPQVIDVKISPPFDSKNTNVFKPDAKIHNIANVILGLDPKPNEGGVLQNNLISSSVNLGQISNPVPLNTNADIHLKEENIQSQIQNTNNISIPNQPTQTSNKIESIPKPIHIPSVRKEGITDHDDDNDFPDEEDEQDKAFLQKHFKISDLENDLSFYLTSDPNIIKNNKIQKLSVEEIKNSARKFMGRLKNQINEDKKEELKENSFLQSKISTSSTLFSEDNKSFQNLNKASGNLVNLLSNNLRNLDDEFYQLKHNIIMSLMK